MKITWASVKATTQKVIHELPAIRKEIVAGATSALGLVSTFEVLYPQVSAAHLAVFSTVTAVLTGTVTFLTNNKVEADINNISKT